MSVNGEEIIVEPAIPEPTAETGGRTLEDETIEQLEDRLIVALERSEQLETRLAECERQIRELESGRTLPQPNNPNPTNGTLDTSPGERKSDTPPRSSNIWFRKWGE